jgi:hypothetical protein
LQKKQKKCVLFCFFISTALGSFRVKRLPLLGKVPDSLLIFLFHLCLWVIGIFNCPHSEQRLNQVKKPWEMAQGTFWLSDFWA